MNPITIPNPAPGTTTTRTRIEPQPPYDWLRPIVDKKTGEVSAYCDSEPTGAFAPHAPGEYWVREPLRGVIDTKFTAGETMPICGYATGERDHIWTNRQAREPWRWGKRPTVPAEEMPREFSRFTARVSVAVEQVDGVWEWVETIEVKGKE